MPGSAITIQLWTDAAASRSVASDLAVEAAHSIFRSTGMHAAVAMFDVQSLEPGDVVALSVPSVENAAVDDSVRSAVDVDVESDKA